MGMCLARQPEVVIIEDYTRYTDVGQTGNDNGVNYHDQKGRKSGHKYSSPDNKYKYNAKKSLLDLRRSTSSCSAIKDSKSPSPALIKKLQIFVCHYRHRHKYLL